MAVVVVVVVVPSAAAALAVVAAWLISIACSQEIASINGYGAPFVFGQFRNGPYAKTFVACSSASTDCYFSLQSAGTCANNVLTLPNYLVAAGTTQVVNISRSPGTAGTMYEVCLHASVATTVSRGSGFFFLLLPRATRTLPSNVVPANISAGSVRPLFVLPYQPRGTLALSSMSMFSYTMSVVGETGFPPGAVIDASLMPSCDNNSKVAEYVAGNVTPSLPLSVTATIVAASPAYLEFTFTYPQLYHLWNMIERGVPSPPPTIPSLREGRVCLAVRSFQVNSSYTVVNNASSLGVAFPVDLGLSVRLASDFRIGGTRILRQEDTGNAAASVSRMYLVSSRPAAMELVFDHVTNTSSTADDVANGLTSEQATADINVSISADIRSLSYPCASYTSQHLQALGSAALFALGTWSLDTSLVTWDVLLNYSAAVGFANGAASGMICLYVASIPVLTTHLRASIFTTMISEPSTVQYVTNSFTSVDYGSVLDPVVALTTVLQATDTDVVFNLTAFAPPLSTMRFTTFGGSCGSISSASATHSIVTPTTRFLTLSGAQWLTGSRAYARLCVAVISNASMSGNYYFQDLSIPFAVVITAFSSIAGGQDQFFVPLGVSGFNLVLGDFVLNTSPYGTTRLRFAFAPAISNCTTQFYPTVSTRDIGVAGTSTYSSAAPVPLQLATTAAQTPSGTFATNDMAYLCIGDSRAVAVPTFPLPLTAPSIGATFFSVLLAGGYPLNRAESTLVLESGSRPALLGFLVDSTDGLSIPITVLVRSGTVTSAWTLSRVLNVVRLSTTGSSTNAVTGCTTANGAQSVMTQTTTYVSRDSTDQIRLTGTVSLSNITGASAVGLRYVCLSTTATPGAAVEHEEDYFRSTFPVGVVSVTSINDVQLPANVSIGAVQFVSVVWTITGTGFTSVSALYLWIGNTRVFITVTNDTTATASFSPTVSGSLVVSLSVGALTSQDKHPVFTLNVVGIESIGTFGNLPVVVFAGYSGVQPISLTSTVEVLPTACLAIATGSSSSTCTCAGNANVTFLTASQLLLDLSLTDPSSFAGAFPLCLRYFSTSYFRTQTVVNVVPRISSIGGTAASTSTDQAHFFLRATAPTQTVQFSIAVSNLTTSVTIGIIAALNSTTLRGLGCSELQTYSGVSAIVNVSDVTFVSVPSSSLSTSVVIPLSMTTNTSTESRRLCSAVFPASAVASNVTLALRTFTTDLDVTLNVGTLLVNSFELSTGTNATLPALSQLNTTLNVTLPSAVDPSSLFFGIASDNCAALPLTSAEHLSTVNQTFNFTNLTLQFPASGGSIANLTVPSGITGQVMLCAQLLRGEQYAFTGVFLKMVAFTYFSAQQLFANLTSNSLYATSGAAAVVNATRSATLQGSNLDSFYFQLQLRQQSTDSCFAGPSFPGAAAAATQQFTLLQSTPLDYESMCLVVYHSSTRLLNPIVIHVSMPFSFLGFKSFDVDRSLITAQQTELVAIINVPTVSNLFNVIGYSPSNAVATLPFTTLGAQFSNQSCSESAFLLAFNVTETDTATHTLGIRFNATSAVKAQTLQVCVVRRISGSRTVAASIGMNLIVTQLGIGGATLGTAGNISVTEGISPELKVNGTSLNLLLLYAAITNAATCEGLTSASDATDTQYQKVVSCSSTQGSVAFDREVTDGRHILCIAAVPSSTGTPSELSVNYYTTGISMAATPLQSLYIAQQPSSRANADQTFDRQPIISFVDSELRVVQNVRSNILIVASWIAVSPVSPVRVDRCSACETVTDGESSLFSSSTALSMVDNARFGFQYKLNYSTNDNSINYTLTDAIERSDCPATKFGPLYSTQCIDCIRGANCNGSYRFTVQSSYWRAHEKTTLLYDCGPPYAASQCIANTSTGTCTEGHWGPRCSNCLPGYGKSFDVCVPCDDFATALTTTVALAVAYIILVIFATFSSVTGMDDVRETKHLPILIKLLTSHLSVASTIGQFSSQFPDFLSNLFSGMRSTSRPSPRFASLDCSLHPSTYQSFLFIILIPLITWLFVLVAALVVRLLHFRTDKEFESLRTQIESTRRSLREKSYYSSNTNDPAQSAVALEETGRDALDAVDPSPKNSSVAAFDSLVSSENDGEGITRRSSAAAVGYSLDPNARTVTVDLPVFEAVPVLTDAERELQEDEERLQEYEHSLQLRLDIKTLFILALVVVLLFGYPTIVEESLNMLKCDAIDLGELLPDGTFSSNLQSYFFYDRTLDCNTPTHRLYKLLAYLATLLYGVGIPFASVVVILWFRQNKGVEYSNRLFVFIVCGYDEDRWWWEAMIMWRKLLIAFVLVFVDDQRLQTYLAVWIIMVALALQLWLEPYDEVNMDHLATASLGVMIVTLNFSLLYDYLPADSSSEGVRIGNVVLTVFLFLINATLVAVLVFLVVIHGLMELQYQISVNQKAIRKTLPVAVQQCLFRFARKPIIVLQKVLKKKVREQDRKRRLRNVLGDAEGELVEVKVGDERQTVAESEVPTPAPKSFGVLTRKPSLSANWTKALAKVASAPSLLRAKYLNEEKQNEALRVALQEETRLFEDLLHRHQQLLAQLGRNGLPEVEAAEELKRAFDAVAGGALRPADRPSAAAPPIAPVSAAPQLVVDDIGDELGTHSAPSMPTFSAAAKHGDNTAAALLGAFGVGESRQSRGRAVLRRAHAASPPGPSSPLSLSSWTAPSASPPRERNNGDDPNQDDDDREAVSFSDMADGRFGTRAVADSSVDDTLKVSAKARKRIERVLKQTSLLQ